ncbi:MAG: hypothetical protein ACPG78_04690, partial [Gammaproteobacteria bacterium]
ASADRNLKAFIGSEFPIFIFLKNFVNNNIYIFKLIGAKTFFNIKYTKTKLIFFLNIFFCFKPKSFKKIKVDWRAR